MSTLKQNPRVEVSEKQRNVTKNSSSNVGLMKALEEEGRGGGERQKTTTEKTKKKKAGVTEVISMNLKFLSSSFTID